MALRPTGIRLTVPLHRVGGACIGLTGCRAAVVSSRVGCVCVAIAFPRKRPLMNGLIDPGPSIASVPVPSPAPATDGGAEVDVGRVEPPPPKEGHKVQIQCIEVAFQKSSTNMYPLKITVNIAYPARSIAPSLNDEWFPYLFSNASTMVRLFM